MYSVYLSDGTPLYEPRLSNDYFLINPTLTQTENIPGQLTFSIPEDHPNASYIERLASRVFVYRDDSLIWVGFRF